MTNTKTDLQAMLDLAFKAGQNDISNDWLSFDLETTNDELRTLKTEAEGLRKKLEQAQAENARIADELGWLHRYFDVEGIPAHDADGDKMSLLQRLAAHNRVWRAGTVFNFAADEQGVDFGGAQ